MRRGTDNDFADLMGGFHTRISDKSVEIDPHGKWVDDFEDPSDLATVSITELPSKSSHLYRSSSGKAA
jgi:hypothetical protein